MLTSNHGTCSNSSDIRVRPGALNGEGSFAGKERHGLKISPSEQSGFTLLEIVLVMAVIALFIGLTLPRLPDISGARLQKAARNVSMTMQTARMRAVTLRRYYRVEVDVDADQIFLSYFGPEGTFIRDDEVPALEIKDTDIVDMITSTRGRTREGIGWIHVSPRGFMEPSMVHLRDARGRDLTVSPSPAGGRVRVLDGYVNPGFDLE